MKKALFLSAMTALLMQSVVSYGQQVQHFNWVCSRGGHQGAEIAFARMGDVFRGEYIDPGSQDFCSFPIAGTIDSEGNVNGVCAIILGDGNIFAVLSGKITGDKMQLTWMPSSVEHSEFREMEMESRPIPPKWKAEMAKHPAAFCNFLYPDRTVVVNYNQDLGRIIPLIPKNVFEFGSGQEYGYRIGEWENRTIRIEKGTNEGDVNFHLHIELSGRSFLTANIQGAARLNGNRFRFKEKGYEFEVTVYYYFIAIKTISGSIDLSGQVVDEEVPFTADGIYPFPMGWSFYMNSE